MIKTILTCFLFISFQYLSAQTTASSYKLKAECIYGNILNHDSHVGSLIKNPVTGVEFAIEFQTVGERSWHYYLNFPIVGIATTYLNLGNLEKLGNAFAFYPYLNVPIIRNKTFTLNMKAGAGLSLVTKTYYNTNTDSAGDLLPSLTGTNSAIGSVLNVYFAAGANIEIPINKGLGFTVDYGWNHISNGSVIAPNTGLNMLNGFVGVKYSPNYNKYRVPQMRDIGKLPRKFTTEIIASGAIRQLYYQDKRFFPAGSLSVSELYPLLNYYRMGIGVDAFYDGVFGEVNSASNGSENETKYKRTYIAQDKLVNKLRVGVSWQHEFIMGRLTAGFHFGLYLFNPIKNLENYDAAKTSTLNKPLIYPYSIDKEDGWLYTRASLKYTLSQHLFASIGLKTHLQKAEFIEWGVGYRFQ